MSPLRPPRRPGGRSFAVLLVATLLASVGPVGAVAVVVGADGVVDSDRRGETTSGSQASIGLDVVPVIDLLGQTDPEDEEVGDDDGDEEEEDDDEAVDDEGEGEGEGEDHSDAAEEGDEVNDEDDRDGGEGDDVDDFVETVLTEVASGPDDDHPGDGGPPDDRPERGDEAGDDEAGGPPSPTVDGSNGASTSQVEEPTTTEPPEPARLRVADVSVNRSVVATGEPVRFTARVVNDGEEPGSRDVRLRLFGEVVDARTVTVPGGDDRAVSFVRTIVAPGTFEATVGNVSTTVTVEASGTTTATDARPASQATPGFTVLAALLGLVVTVLFVRLRIG